MSNKPQEDGADPWVVKGSSDSHDGDVHGVDSNSAFGPTRMIDAEEQNEQKQEETQSYEEVNSDSSDQPYQESGAEAHAPEKSRPNIGILAAAGVVLVAILVGAGYLGYKEFGPKPTNQRQAVLLDTQLPSTSSVNVFQDSNPKVNEPYGIFENTNPNSAAIATSAPASAPTSITAATGINTAAVAASSLAVAEKVASKVTAPAPDSKVASLPVQVAVASTETRSLENAKSKTQKTARSVKATKTKVARNTSRNKKPKRVVVAEKEKTETFLLPKGLKVQGFFPQSGPNVQAWVIDAGGRVQVVRTGDTLRSGAQVTSIVAEKNQVITTSGVINTEGVR